MDPQASLRYGFFGYPLFAKMDVPVVPNPRRSVDLSGMTKTTELPINRGSTSKDSDCDGKLRSSRADVGLECRLSTLTLPGGYEK